MEITGNELISLAAIGVSIWNIYKQHKLNAELEKLKTYNEYRIKELEFCRNKVYEKLLEFLELTSELSSLESLSSIPTKIRKLSLSILILVDDKYQDKHKLENKFEKIFEIIKRDKDLNGKIVKKDWDLIRSEIKDIRCLINNYLFTNDFDL